MNFIGNIYGNTAGAEVGIGFKIYNTAFGRNAACIQALFFKQVMTYFVYLDFCQGFFMVVSPIIPLVHPPHQLLNRTVSVPYHMGGYPLGHRHHPVLDYQYPVIITRDIFLHDDVFIYPLGQFKS